MICIKCKENNSNDAKFCAKCGTQLSKSPESGSVDTYFAKQERGCQICGSLAPTKQVEFNQNVGYVFARSYTTIKGRLCKNCINNEFRKKTLITFFFGWWGTISFFVTPVYLIGNLFNYIPTIGMESEKNQ